jgi:DNA (cytosine-5)-methyltransferase 1
MRGATLFSGGGGVEAGLLDTVTFCHAVECDASIAAVYAQNIGAHVQVRKVEDVDYSTWGALDYLHGSPVCKEYSPAKVNGKEGESDLTSAAAVVRCLEATQPRVFTLENVGAYQHSQAFRLIVSWLNHNGYMWHAEILNSADFGVPQTRRRLILRAVRDALLPTLPPPVKWVGWYAAIEDLIPSLPESQFAPWQLARLPEGLQETALVEGTEMRGEITPFLAATPSFTIKAAQYKGLPRAFIVDGQTNDASARITVRRSDAPMYTVSASCDRRPARAFLMRDDNAKQEWGKQYRAQHEPAYSQSGSSGGRAWLTTGRVVKMTPRALARFQSIPDWYTLPAKASLACTIIGNAVPSHMMAAIVRPLL